MAIDIIATGTVLENRYEVLSRLNEGGTSSVYLARRLGVDKEMLVAIKELHPDVVTRAEFQNEVTLLFGLSHPSLPKVYDFFEAAERYYLVMDYVDGNTLAEIVTTDGPLAKDRAVAVMIQLADVLQYLHDNHVLHCDVKPHNIILSKSGRAILLDFGVAKVADGEGVFAYSEGTSPPEQRLSGTVDARSDIYSWGASLFFLLTGRYPGQLMAMSSADGRTIKRDAQLPPEFDPLIRKCLERDPARRYQLVSDLLTDLRRVAAGKPRRWTDRLMPLLLVLPLIALIAFVAWRVASAITDVPPPPTAYVVTAPKEAALDQQLQLSLAPLPEEAVSWRVTEASSPERLLQELSGANASLTLDELGVYTVQAVGMKSGKVYGAAQRIVVAPGGDVVGKATAGAQLVLRSGVSTQPTSLVAWEWQVTDPLGKQETLRSETASARYSFAEVGIYRLRLAAVYVVGGAEVRAVGAEKLVEVVKETLLTGTPINANGSFEEGLNGWTIVGAGGLSTSAAYAGEKSARLAGPATLSGNYASMQVLVVDGGQYTVQVRVRGRAVSGTQQLELRFRSTTNDGYVAEPVKVTGSFGGDFEWQRLQGNLTIPSGGVIVEIFLRISGRGTVWFDNVLLVPR